MTAFLIAWDRDLERWQVLDAKTRKPVHDTETLADAEAFVLEQPDDAS